MITHVVIILVISQLGTGSLNPIEVFRGDNVLLKILVGFFLVLLAFTALLLVMMGQMGNERCAKCGNLLLQFAPVYGAPVKCRHCNRWYHTMCIKADGGSVFTGCRQPHCPSGHTQF